jgi:hypothetical protein
LKISIFVLCNDDTTIPMLTIGHAAAIYHHDLGMNSLSGRGRASVSIRRSDDAREAARRAPAARENRKAIVMIEVPNALTRAEILAERLQAEIDEVSDRPEYAEQVRIARRQIETLLSERTDSRRHYRLQMARTLVERYVVEVEATSEAAARLLAENDTGIFRVLQLRPRTLSTEIVGVMQVRRPNADRPSH